MSMSNEIINSIKQGYYAEQKWCDPEYQNTVKNNLLNMLLDEAKNRGLDKCIISQRGFNKVINLK